jgi:hypothetical protein
MKELELYLANLLDKFFTGLENGLGIIGHKYL